MELVGGRQPDFGLNVVAGTDLNHGATSAGGAALPQRTRPLAARVSEAERKAHEVFIAEEISDALWLKTK